MRWKNKEEFLESSGKTNVVLAANITAQARLKLYSYLDKLESRALCADNDSVVFIDSWRETSGNQNWVTVLVI